MQNAFEGVEGLGAVAQRFGECRRAEGEDHIFLEIETVRGVLPAIDDIHHRSWESEFAGRRQTRPAMYL
jgi:hypothetical protein